MIAGQVMDEIADALRAIPDLRVHGYFPDRITPPAALIDFPDVVFDATYVRGADRMTLPVAVLVSRVDSRTARDRLLLLAGQVKVAVEDHAPTSYDSARVVGQQFNHSYPMAGVEYSAAVFSVDIFGKGD